MLIEIYCSQFIAIIYIYVTVTIRLNKFGKDKRQVIFDSKDIELLLSNHINDDG